MGMRKLLLISFLFPLFIEAQTPMSKLLRKKASSGCSDSDASAFAAQVISNGGTLSPTEQTAVCQLVVDLKAASLWTKFTGLGFIYPFVGGSSASCSVNLANPAARTCLFPNSATFNSTGVDWNGSNQYGNSQMDLSTLSTNDATLIYYSRQNVNEGSVDMGGGTGALGTHDIELFNTVWYSYNGTSGTDYATSSLSTTVGVFINTAYQAGSFDIYQDGTSLNTKSATLGTNAGYLCFIGARAGAANAPGNFSTKECGFAAVGTGMTPTDVANFTTIINAFKTALSR